MQGHLFHDTNPIAIIRSFQVQLDFHFGTVVFLEHEEAQVLEEPHTQVEGGAQEGCECVGDRSEDIGTCGGFALGEW